MSPVIDSRRRLVSALDSFASYREKGVRSKRHIGPLVKFAASELVERGIPIKWIKEKVRAGYFYSSLVDLVVESSGRVKILILVVTQSGSVRKNLNNRRRDIVGEAINLRLAHPDARLGVIYFLRADREALRRGAAGTNPVQEMAAFLRDLQEWSSPFQRALLDGAALLAANRDKNGRIKIEQVIPEVDVLGQFFDKLAVGDSERS